jgi:hypothetical protein
MLEDKLNQDMRVRLEAIAQANQTLGAPMRATSAERVLDVAARYEVFITEGTTDDRDQ